MFTQNYQSLACIRITAAKHIHDIFIAKPTTCIHCYLTKSFLQKRKISTDILMISNNHYCYDNLILPYPFNFKIGIIQTAARWLHILIFPLILKQINVFKLASTTN